MVASKLNRRRTANSTDTPWLRVKLALECGVSNEKPGRKESSSIRTAAIWGRSRVSKMRSAVALLLTSKLKAGSERA